MTDFYFEMPTNGLITVAPFANEWGNFNFRFPICSALAANDGALPYGDSISTVDVEAYEGEIMNSADISGGTEITDLIDDAQAPAVSGKDTVNLQLQYPSSFTGDATLYFKLTLASGAQQGFLFRKVTVG